MNLIEIINGREFFVAEALLEKLIGMGFIIKNHHGYFSSVGYDYASDNAVEVSPGRDQLRYYSQYILKSVTFTGYGLKLRVDAKQGHKLEEKFNAWMRAVAVEKTKYAIRAGVRRQNDERVNTFLKDVESATGRSVSRWDVLLTAPDADGFRFPTGVAIKLQIVGTPEEIARKLAAVCERASYD